MIRHLKMAFNILLLTEEVSGFSQLFIQHRRALLDQGFTERHGPKQSLVMDSRKTFFVNFVRKIIFLHLYFGCAVSKLRSFKSFSLFSCREK